MTNFQAVLMSAPIVVVGLVIVWSAVVAPLRRSSIKRMRDPAKASFLVTAVSAPSEDAAWTTGTVTGIVTIPGHAPFAHRHEGLLRSSKFPQPGNVLPIVIDRADARRLAILWNEIGHAADTALADAHRLADLMRDEPR